MSSDEAIVLNVNESLTSSNGHRFTKFISFLGWDPEEYLKVNPDLGSITSPDKKLGLIKHFLTLGVHERRRFSCEIDYAKNYYFDDSIRSGDYLLVSGWSETELSEPKVVMQEADGNFSILRSRHVTYWRDDVAEHLGLHSKKIRHGFLVLIQMPEGVKTKELPLVIRDDNLLLVGTMTPGIVPAEEFVLASFNILQVRMNYEELVRSFNEYYPYLEFLRQPMSMLLAEEPSDFLYGDLNDESEVDMSVCAVLLGAGYMLKPFIISLMAKRPVNSRWEILLLANSGLDVENIKSAAEWCSEVYGINVTVFSHTNNLGFGGGMNLLVSHARGKVAMLSNIDLRFDRFDLGKIEKEMASEKMIVAAFQFNPWGSLQHEGLVHEQRKSIVNGRQINFLQTRLLGRNTYPGEIVRKEVEYFGAACLVANTTMLRELGPFSEDYFYAYHEDCDLARRARAQGIKCVLSPELQVVHYESTGAASVPMPLRAINAANLVTFMKGNVPLTESTI